MSHYVVSDVHGEDDRWKAMLEKIHFSAQDTLYILGDVVDRGPHGVEILQEIMRTPNMKMLLGNHEFMCLRYFAPDAPEKHIQHWNRNGNTPTLEGFSRLTQPEREQVLEFLRSLPTHFELTVGEQKFYLVHGLPADTVYDEVWHRPYKDPIPPIARLSSGTRRFPVLSIPIRRRTVAPMRKSAPMCSRCVRAGRSSPSFIIRSISTSTAAADMIFPTANLPASVWRICRSFMYNKKREARGLLFF